MADSNIIKEFLVSLGFRTDEAALKKFENGIVQATKVTFALGAAVEAVAVSVGIGVARFAANLEALYFASQRTHASANELRAFGRTARGMGVSIEEATGSIENLQHFIRTNPGWQNALGDWFGVKTTAGESPVRMVQDIAVAMRAMTEQQAIMRGGMAGLSELTVLMLRNPDFDRKFLTVFDRLKNAGFNTAAEHAHRFMESLRELGDWLVIIGTRIEDALQKKLGLSLQSIVIWLQQNQQWIITSVVDIANWFLDAFNKILQWTLFNWPQIKAKIVTAFFEIKWAWEMYLAPALSWIWDKFLALDKATGGWATTIVLLTVALRALGAAEIVAGVAGLAGAFARLAPALVAVGGPIIATVAALRALKKMKEGEVGPPHRSDIERWSESGIAGLFGGRKRWGDYVLGRAQGGFSAEQNAGILDVLQAESGLDPDAVGDSGSAYGIAQWHKPGQDEFKKWSGGQDIRTSGLSEQLHFLIYQLSRGSEIAAGGLIRAQQSEQAAVSAMLNFERPRDWATEAQRALNFSQNTTIHVTGSSDPHATADAVAQRQQRVNEQVMRTFAATVPGG